MQEKERHESRRGRKIRNRKSERKIMKREEEEQ